MSDKIRKIERTLKYTGHRVKVYEDTMITPEGEKLYYDYVENRNGAGILLVDEDGKLVASVEPEGTPMTIRREVEKRREPVCTILIRPRIICSQAEKSAITPSRNGRMVRILS